MMVFNFETLSCGIVALTPTWSGSFLVDSLRPESKGIGGQSLLGGVVSNMSAGVR